MRTNQIVKASLFTLILALMAIGTMAIAEVMKKEKPVKEERAVVMQTWYFQGGDPENPSSYARTQVDGKPCGSLAQTICELEAPENPAVEDQPDLNATVGSATVLEHIQQAMASLGDSPTTNDAVKSFRIN